MALVPPFFRHIPHPTGIMSLPPLPERYPYHDNNQCPVGQDIKHSGLWQYYEPQQETELRPRCPVCAKLDRLGH